MRIIVKLMLLLGYSSMSWAQGVVVRSSQTQLEKQSQQVAPTVRDGQMSTYQNSNLGERLPSAKTPALGPDLRMQSGIAPRLCFAPEMLGSYQAARDELVAEKIPFYSSAIDGFICLLRECTAADLEDVLADRPPSANGAACHWNAEQQAKVDAHRHRQALALDGRRRD